MLENMHRGKVRELPVKASGATSHVALGVRSVNAHPVSKGFPETGCIQGREGLQNVVRTWAELFRYY